MGNETKQIFKHLLSQYF